MNTDIVSDGSDNSVVQDSENSNENENKKDSVKYETYQRTLRQLKKAQEQNSAFEERFKAFEDDRKAADEEKRQMEKRKLEEKGEFKKLLELKEKELGDLNQRLNAASEETTSYKKAILDTKKLHAIYQKLPGKIKKQEYINFLDLDSVVINPETNEVEASSVEEVVNKFMGSYGELVDTSHLGKLPAGSPANTEILDYKKWKGASSKEMKKNLKTMIEKRMSSS